MGEPSAPHCGVRRESMGWICGERGGGRGGAGLAWAGQGGAGQDGACSRVG